MNIRRITYWLGLLAFCVGCQNQSAFQGPPLGVVADVNAIRVIVPTHERQEDMQALVRARAEAFVNRCKAPLNCIITDDEALTSDLSDYNLVVFGTPRGNRWLQSHMEALPVALGLDRLITGMMHAGPHLGFITCWPHPDNPKRGMLIFTAFQAEYVGVYQAPLLTDYGVTRGDNLIEANNYIKDKGIWSFPVWGLTAAQASEDLKFLFKTIESVHPDAEGPWQSGGYNQFKAVCQIEVAKLENDEKHIPRAELHEQLGLICASYQDGHTRVVMDRTIADTSDFSLCMLPFRLNYHADTLCVGRTIDLLDHIRGYKIVAFNERAPLEQLRPVLGTISGERVAHRIQRFIQEQRTYWALARPVGEDLVDLMVEDPNGEKQSYVIDLMSLADYDALWSRSIEPQGGPLTFYQENQIATLDYRRFLSGSLGNQDLDDVFRTLQARKTTHLILDLRCDGRDRQQAVTTLISYLLDRPSLVYAQTDTKISPEIIARGQQQDFRKREGEVISTVFDPQAQEPRQARFSGTLFVLIGSETYGAAADLAAVLKDYDRGTLVGAETGGLREHYGNAQVFTLAHSGFAFEVSTTKCYPPLPRPDDDQRGTVPDVEFTPSMLAPHLQDTDPTLSFVVETVTKRLAPKP